MDFFTSPNPNFFRVILPHILIEEKLVLPKKFIMKNGGDSMLYNMATLKLPDGAIWEVELKKSDDEVSFAEGWLEFMKFYSVEVGYFLVFRPQGNWCFDVSIFDLSTTEIDYRVKLKIFRHDRGIDRKVPIHVPKSENENYKGEDVQEVEMERKGEKNQEVAYLKKKIKKMKMKIVQRSTAHQQSNDKEDEEDEDLKIDHSKRRSNLKGSGSNYGEDRRSGPVAISSGHPRRTPRPLTKNEERVQKVATSFKLRTKNPSFMVTMRPSYIQTGHSLSLPKNFAKRYLKESTDVTLELANGRIWSMSSVVRWVFTRLRTEFKYGWKEFTVDNELHEGDICVFELMNKIPQVKFRVTIFRLPPN